MILGLSRPTTGEVERARPRARARRSRAGWSSAVMQTGGLLKDLTVRETVEYTASLFADTRPVDEVLANAGITGIADRKVGQVLRRRAAAAAVRDGAAVRPGAAAPRRADHRHGRRGPARLLVGDPRGRRAGPHGAVRDPLPRGGRPVRRPDRADQPGPDRRRRHRRRDQGARRRPDRPGHPPRRRHRRPSLRSVASTASRCAATPCSCTPRTATRSPATC